MDEALKDDLVREITEFLEQQWPEASARGSATITDRQLRLAIQRSAGR